MVECEYCGAHFESDDAHLEHLEAEHPDELGPIDKRRVAATDGGGGEEGLPLTGLLGGAAVLVLVVAAIYVLFLSGGGGGGVEGAPGAENPNTPTGTVDATPTGIEDEPLPDQGDEKWISQVETFESEGHAHPEEGTQINYTRIPPLSGDHYGIVEAGFYTETPKLPNIVHALEHGAVVIYYDEANMTPAAEASLRAWAENHQGTWTSIIVAPNPNEDPRGDYVLTAWTHRLVIQEYSAEAVQAFAAEYLGRGPENQVR